MGDVETIATEKHYTIGGSNSWKWRKCSLSPWLEKLVPRYTTPAMAEGTRLHAELERCLREKDDSSEEKVQAALDAIQILVSTRLRGQVVSEGIEAQLAWPGYEDVGGTADWFATTNQGELVVLDFKSRLSTGVNDQLQFYGALVTRHYIELFDRLPSRLLLVCVSESGTSLVEYDSESKITELMLQVEMDIGFALAERKGNYGDWCEMCQGAGICKEFSKNMEKTMEIMGNEIETTSRVEMALVLTNRKKFENYIESLVAYAKSQAVDGTPIEGEDGFWVLKEGNRVRVWRDDASERLVQLGVKDFSIEKIKSVGEIEKSYKKETGEKLPDDLFTLRQNSASLVFDSNE